VNWALERYINVFGSDFNIGVNDLDFNGVIGFPSVVGDASVRLDRGDWTYTWFTNYVGRQDNNRNFANDLNEPSSYFGLQGLYKVHTEAEFRHGASIRWQGDTLSITGGIRNIFDEQPPQVSDIIQTSAGNTPLQGTGYDIRGRRAFVSVSKTF
jgi:iron complex outermembrane receptor protein